MGTTVIKSDRLTFATLTGDPASVVDGDFWYRADLDKAKVSIGTIVANAKTIPTIPVQAADIADLPTTKITSGTFDAERIPDLPASKIVGGTFSSSLVGTLSAAKITYGTMGAAKISGARITYGSIPGARFGTISASKLTYGTMGAAQIAGERITYGSIAAARTQALQNLYGTVTSNKLGTHSTAKLTYGSLPSTRLVNLDTEKITTGTFLIARIPDLDTSKITSGTFAVTRIPGLDQSKITSGTFPSTRIPSLDAGKITTGTFPPARIPNLDANKITTGTFTTARIPDLDTSKITSGTLAVARHQLLPNIPGSLDASKIGSGTFASARIPDLDASKITSGSFLSIRIGTLSAAKITYGTLPMRDVAGGVAGLDDGGCLVVPGNMLYVTRDEVNKWYFAERTSLETAFFVERIGADDYDLFVLETGTNQQIQTASMKDVAGGIAGLDANALLPSTRLGTHPASKITYGTIGSAKIAGEKITYGSIAAARTQALQNLYGTVTSNKLGTHSTAKLTYGSLPAARLVNLDTSKITTGTFTTARIPGLDQSKITSGTFPATRIPSLDTSKITSGTFVTDRVPVLPIDTKTSGTLDLSTRAKGTLAAQRIPDLDTSKITTGTFTTSRIPNLDASKITSGSLPSTRIGTLSAAKLTYGTIGSAKISGARITHGTIEPFSNRIGSVTAANITYGTMGSAKIAGERITHGSIAAARTQALSNLYGTVTSNKLGTHSTAKLTYGSLPAARIANLDASKITTGTFVTARIPNLDSNKITSGTLATARIPGLDQAKITSGTFPSTRIPSLDASKVTTGTFTTPRIPSLDASKITSGSLSSTRIGTLSAAKLTYGTYGGANFYAPTLNINSGSFLVGSGGQVNVYDHIYMKDNTKGKILSPDQTKGIQVNDTGISITGNTYLAAGNNLGWSDAYAKRLSAGSLKTCVDLYIGSDDVAGSWNIAITRANPIIYFGDRTGAFDVNLYRAGPDELKTDDNVTIVGITDIGSIGYNLRFLAASPTIQFGDRATTYDVNLYRSAANFLKTDDSFVIEGDFYLDRGDTGKSILFGSLNDVNLYREAANLLRTDDNLKVVGTLNVGGNTIFFSSATAVLYIGGTDTAGAISIVDDGGDPRLCGIQGLPFYVGVAGLALGTFTKWDATTNNVLVGTKIGIQTATPVSKLSFGSTHDDVTSRIAVYEIAGGTYFYGIGMAHPSGYGLGLWGGIGDAVPTDTNMHMFIASITGNVGIGATGPRYKLEVVSGTANTAGDAPDVVGITGANRPFTGAIQNLVIESNSDMAIDAGGSIGFGGRYITASTAAGHWAAIRGGKATATSGEYGGYLAFGTRIHGGEIIERMRIDTNGNVGIGVTPSAGALHIYRPRASNIIAIQPSDSDGAVTALQLKALAGTNLWDWNYWSDTYQIKLYSYQKTGGAGYVFGIDKDGVLDIGGQGDTNLYRSAANRLKTDDHFRVDGAIFVAGGYGVNFGNDGAEDVNLYRSAANVLRTDDELYTIGMLNAAGWVTGQSNSVHVGFTDKGLIGSYGTVPSYADLELYGTNIALLYQGGRVLIGASDVNLYRSAADTLKTDDTFDALALNIGGTQVITSARVLQNVTFADRDVASGIAGLDAGGNILAQGSTLFLKRDVANDVYICERTSGEIGLRVRRMDVSDFQLYVFESSSAQRIQTASMKGIASGICDLDASVLVPLARIPATLTGKTAEHVSTAADAHPTNNYHLAGNYAAGGVGYTTTGTHTHSGEEIRDIQAEMKADYEKRKGKKAPEPKMVDQAFFDEIQDVITDWRTRRATLSIAEKIAYIEKLMGIS